MLLLAALPTAVPLPQVAPALDMSVVYLLVLASSLPAIAGLGLQFVTFLGKRTVDREDKDKEDLKVKQASDKDELKSKQVELEARLEKQNERASERFSEMEHKLIQIQADQKTTANEVSQIRGSQQEIRGAQQELKVSMENRFEKQSEFYKAANKEQLSAFTEKLKDVEFSIRQEVTRAVADVIANSRPKPKRKL